MRTGPRVVLTHVRVDGTGAAAVPDRNLVIENGRISAIGPGAAVAAEEGRLPGPHMDVTVPYLESLTRSWSSPSSLSSSFRASAGLVYRSGAP
ncbi:MAG TPA: hypothetical protein VMX54_19490 [Vicinamibacteria bacterium]|nr:hypothetical protein [Vicinamibacteria bacterium]